MLGTILCRVGLHKWEWRSEWHSHVDKAVYGLTTYYRCRRRCHQFGHWRVADRDVRTIW
jgi:hypothetical protein